MRNNEICYTLLDYYVLETLAAIRYPYVEVQYIYTVWWEVSTKSL